METTTNYGFRKYQSGDLFNPLTVNNPNLDDIDTDMKAVSDRAIGRATELVSQGVHAITLLDTDCKTFKFVATGNYSAGETFTVNGIQANAYTPSGSSLTTNAFVTGSIVLGALNEDNTAITFYVTGSAVADDSLKLGGELPSYYAKQSDMTSANTDITNLKNQAGNTSIAGIGDGTLSGAVSSLNNDLDDLKNINVHSTTPVDVGTDVNGKPIYRKVYTGASLLNGQVIDMALNSNTVKWFTVTGCFAGVGNELNHIPYIASNYMCNVRISANGMNAQISNLSITSYYIIVDYVLI